MQFSYISAFLATLALSNAVALPQPDAAALVPADAVNDIEVRDPQLGLGLGVGVSVGVSVSASIDVTREYALIQKTCGPACTACATYIACFQDACDQQGYSWQQITALRARFGLSASVQIGLGADFSVDHYEQQIRRTCPDLGYSCFTTYCQQQGYSKELIATLALSLDIKVSASSTIGN